MSKQSELDEILREMRYRTLEDNGLTVNGLKTIEQETKQAILDWHHKQVTEALKVAYSEIALGYTEAEFVEQVTNELKESKDE